MVRAALGQREEDDGTTCPIEPDRAGAARRQAARIVVISVLFAAAAAGIVWVIGRRAGFAG